jgi:hypothetical protein
MSTAARTAERADGHWSGEDALRQELAEHGLDAGLDRTTPPASHRRGGCPVLDWAASGAMSITGRPEAPAWPDGDVLATLGGAGRLLTELAGHFGAHQLSFDLGRLLCARAAIRSIRTPDDGDVRRGTVSFGGHCRLFPTGADWIAINLSRPEDVASLPALSSGRIDPAVIGTDLQRLWSALAQEVSGRPAAEVVEAAQELGMPASVLGEVVDSGAAKSPWSIRTLGAGALQPSAGRQLLVVDFTAMWAGPLCAHLLAGAGARVVTVEAIDRPDGARFGDPRLYAELHRGHDRLVVDFADVEGRRRITDVVASADVVLEASRPRALSALGLDAEDFLTGGPGRTWVSITGYGRSGPRSGRVAFGDDAAVAGGLVGRDPNGDPVFCADAVADPVTGVLAAVAALASVTAGGGHLVDCSMSAASAFVNQGGRCPGVHRVERQGDGWMAFCDEAAVPVTRPWVQGEGHRAERSIGRPVTISSQ